MGTRQHQLAASLLYKRSATKVTQSLLPLVALHACIWTCSDHNQIILVYKQELLPTVQNTRSFYLDTTVGTTCQSHSYIPTQCIKYTYEHTHKCAQASASTGLKTRVGKHATAKQS